MMIDDFPEDDNGEVLRHMQQNGDDFTKPRDVNFSVVFPSQSTAEAFAQHFRISGLKVAVEELSGDRELPWDVTVTRYMLPTHAEITEVERALEDTAAPLGGSNDGWGCFRQSVTH